AQLSRSCGRRANKDFSRRLGRRNAILNDAWSSPGFAGKSFSEGLLERLLCATHHVLDIVGPRVKAANCRGNREEKQVK
ncbi:MAG: hypothetical protein WAL20_17415, partial [Rhodomicrobium sp.]